MAITPEQQNYSPQGRRKKWWEPGGLNLAFAGGGTGVSPPLAQPSLPTLAEMGINEYVVPEGGAMQPWIPATVDWDESVEDLIPMYSDVNPFIWNQLTGAPDRSYFDETIDLLTARHPDFSSEYAANPQEALLRYDEPRYGSLSEAQLYHTEGPQSFQMGITPAMVDASLPRNAQGEISRGSYSTDYSLWPGYEPGMVPMSMLRPEMSSPESWAAYGASPQGGLQLPPGLVESMPTGPVGLLE